MLTAILAFHIALIDPTFNGPDAESNVKFAKFGQDWSYWLDPSAFWDYLFPMGYGTFLALVARTSGGSLVPAQYLQVLMVLSMCVSGWFITRHVSVRARLLTVAAIGFSPSVIWLGRTNGYEILLACTTTVAAAILWGYGGRHVDRGSWRITGPFLAGLLMGIALLSQGKVSVVIPVMLIMAWKWGKSPAVTFAVSASLLPFLWSIRNLFVLGRFYPFNSSSEVVIWMGNNWSTIKGEYVLDPPPLPEGYGSYYAASLDFVLTQPERAFSLFLTRMARLLEPTFLYLPGLSTQVNVILHFLFILLATIGSLLFASYLFGRIWVKPPMIPQIGYIAAIVVCFVLVHIPFATEARHLKPIVPLALCVTMPTLLALLSLIGGRLPRRQGRERVRTI